MNLLPDEHNSEEPQQRFWTRVCERLFAPQKTELSAIPRASERVNGSLRYQHAPDLSLYLGLSDLMFCADDKNITDTGSDEVTV